MNSLQALAAALRIYRATGEQQFIIRRYHPAFPVHYDVVHHSIRYSTLRNFDTIYRSVGR